MNLGRALALFGLFAVALPSAAAAEVQVSLANGRVSVTAKDATVRQILAEWSKVGQVKIVNAERIPGGPLTLELKDMPEEQALDLLLRSVAGYMAAPRPDVLPNASRFDRVIVMATAAVPRAPVAASPALSRPPVFEPVPQPTADDPADDQTAPPIPVPSLNPRGPVFNTFPQPQVVNPPPQVPAPDAEQNPEPAQTPTVFPGTVSVPGMIAQPPQQPGQPTDRR